MTLFSIQETSPSLVRFALCWHVLTPLEVSIPVPPRPAQHLGPERSVRPCGAGVDKIHVLPC